MPVTANTFQRVAQIGVREEILDKIYDVSPEDHMASTYIGRKVVENVYPEWQTDELRASNADNALEDGGDFVARSVTQPKRIANHCQVFSDTFRLSRRAMKSNAAGRSKNEKGYQKARAIQAMKKDVEKRLLSNLPAVAPTASVAGKFASFGASIDWASTANGSLGATGVQPAWPSGAVTTAPTNGTNRAFTEALLKQVLQAHYNLGGNCDGKMLFMNAQHKQVASGFAGIAQLRKEASGKKAAVVVGAVDVYVSDFGAVTFAADRECDANTAFLIDDEYAVLGVHDDFKTSELAKTSDAETYGITFDCTLLVNNPRAHAKIAALNNP